jgi:hypothetical protein
MRLANIVALACTTLRNASAMIDGCAGSRSKGRRLQR